ncbi:hypothetical protein [Mycobacteroides abscessus]|uniref:hypothetical protein n=1 Tax=Mycobacteroides abscessus TaxID=36809 RepID=UPI0002584723|nr:hypothetical protein [Mycobacteroides abscessus]EIC64345.1 hypothetical protein OUW_16382 [Mycobacteroides abscessus M93]
MSTTTGPNNHRWLRKWLRLEPHQPIGAEGEPPYLLRWYVIPRNRWVNVYLHKFLRDDEDRALVDTRSSETYDDLDRIVASTDGQVEVERFIPWDEFGAAGCGEPVGSDR